MSKNSLSKTLALMSINLGLPALVGLGYSAIMEESTGSDYSFREFKPLVFCAIKSI